MYISRYNNKRKLQLKQKSLAQLRSIKGNMSESCRSFIISCVCDCFLRSGDKCLYAVYGRGHIHMLVLEVKEFRFCIRFSKVGSCANYSIMSGSIVFLTFLVWLMPRNFISSIIHFKIIIDLLGLHSLTKNILLKDI